ncbi:MAG: fused MFS/spermidine synthase [Paracoccaceae bacterium]
MPTDSPAAGLSRSLPLAPVLFTLTIFTSAALLFFVQPLFTKIVLPQIGGAPAVWTTAMLFFQTVLIAGYLYAHISARYLAPRVQLGLHLALWATALLFLPLAIPAGWSYAPTGSAALQTLVLYALGVGLPFAVLSANAPLLQAWYARSGGPAADDPYFLYSASNLGSLIALLAFPLIAEPFFGATRIGQGWAAGFVALGALLAACGMAAARHPMPAARTEAPAAAWPPIRTLAFWAFLAFIPSSLMLGVTSKIATDLGSIPLIWVVPLTLYLLTFVIAFSNHRLLGGGDWRLLLLASLVILVVLTSGLLTLDRASAVLLVLGFFGAALTAHRMLFLRRPDAGQLTVFYLTMSVGGALGGLFNSLIAPVIFDDFHELWITTGLAAHLLIGKSDRTDRRALSFGILIGGAAVLPAALHLFGKGEGAMLPTTLAVAAILALGLWYLRRNGAAAAAAAVFTLCIAFWSMQGDAIHRDRSFFGAHEILDRDGTRFYSNGTTVHGAERLAALGDARPDPLMYYTPDGPMGQVLGSDWAAHAGRIGVVGLGVGSLACYARPGQDWHFYEIDRVVDQIARNPAYFTFMQRCAGDAPTHLGDARIVLAQQPGLAFNILVIDAYSSDAVPVHLTTLEALQLYRDRLTPGGIVLFHISNRFYAIDRPLGRSAAALGLEALIQRFVPATASPDMSESASVVVAIGSKGGTIERLRQDARWRPLPSDGGPLWTDDHADPLSILD